jgi:membrane fusion protein (multidrug efflux system)
MKSDSKKNPFKVYIPLIIVIGIVLAGCWYWYRDYSRYISSDDAKIDADYVSISSKMLGRIIALHGEEGDLVSKGMLLAELDSSDLLAQKNQSIALREQSSANMKQAEVKYSSDMKSIKVLEINLERTTDDLARSKSQMDAGIITQEVYDHVNKAFETAQAQLDAAKAQLTVSKAQISTAKSAVESSGAQIKVVESQLRNTKLYAPFDGIISKRWLMPGDITSPGQSIFTVTINNKLWVSAFLEETNISEIKPGQKVQITVDAFPDEKFNGVVYLVGSNTAAMFSLIPQNNASGNFTKVTQRIPIRISIDGVNDQQDLSSYNLMAGMSVEIKIIK